MIPQRSKGAGKPWLWLLLAFGVAWAAGHSARRADSAPVAKPLAEEAKPRGSPSPRSQPQFAPFTRPAWGISGGLELADLMAMPAGLLRKTETALWLGRARPDELAEWWPALVAEKPQDWALLDLVMIRWMELAPHEALELVAGTPEEFRAWLAWGRINPRLAAREAEARGSGFLWRVLQGAGYGDPITARELIAEYPAFAYPAVTHAIQDGLKNLGWLESLEFGYSGETLQSWAAHEPEKAFEWALANATKLDEETWARLAEALHESDPGRFSETMEKIPSGVLRQRLMLAQVKFLAARDPEAAISQARAAGSPALRNHLLATLGPDLTLRDPRRSLELFREFLDSGGTSPGMRVIRPNGSSFTGSSDARGQEWLGSLVKQDPQTVYELTREVGIVREGVDMHQQARDLWLGQDRKGFAAYLHAQPPGEDRDDAFINAARSIEQRSHGIQAPVPETMTEVMDWLSAVEEAPRRELQTSTMIGEWLRRDAASAAEFFRNGGPATAEQRAIYSKVKGAAQ